MELAPASAVRVVDRPSVLRLALFLFTYYPYGGLQRDFLSIARACVALGHQVDVYCGRWTGPRPEGLSVSVLPSRGHTNHARNRSLYRGFQAAVSTLDYDARVGFDRIPGLDVYYAADTCYADKARRQHGWLYRLTPRYRQRIAFESALFRPEAGTEILLLTAEQLRGFQRHYRVPAARCHLLPPGIDRQRQAPENAAGIRADFRRELQLGDHDRVLLMVASRFGTKGVDRALRALAAAGDRLPGGGCLFVVGEDDPAPYQGLIRRLGIAPRVRFFRGRDDVTRFMLGADALIHPSLVDSAGNVILEAIVAGLPVLATGNCGYAHYVEEAGAGLVVPPPFDQRALDEATVEILTSAQRPAWRRNGVAFGAAADIYSRPEYAAGIISDRARRNREARAA
jgi:UDP-glucose:(heptosyl)LPS alpha-1,3-glucosyltransferase